METIFEQMPIIFSGKVTSVEEVDAPTHDLYLTNQTKALAAHIEIDNVWKGPDDKTRIVYTWPKGAAPCTGVTMEAGKSYIIWAETDSTGKVTLFDFCRDFTAEDSISAPSIRAQLDRLFAKKPSPQK